MVQHRVSETLRAIVFCHRRAVFFFYPAVVQTLDLISLLLPFHRVALDADCRENFHRFSTIAESAD